MTIVTIDCEEFYNLCQNYRWAPTEHQDRVIEAYNRLVSYCDSKIAASQQDAQRLQEEVGRLKSDILEQQIKYAKQVIKMLPPKVNEMVQEIIDGYAWQIDTHLSLNQKLAEQQAEVGRLKDLLKMNDGGVK